MALISRSTTGSDKFVVYKTVLLVAGLGFFLFGIRLEEGWLVWVAIAFLAMGFLLRFFPGSTGHSRDEERGAKIEERRANDTR